MRRRITILVGLLIVSVGITVTVAPPLHAATVYDDAIGYWNFDDGTANDGTTNANNGTVYGATATSGGAVGGAFIFNGSSNYIEIPDSVSLDDPVTTQNFTMSVWLKAVNNGASENKILSRWNYYAGNEQFQLNYFSGGDLHAAAGGNWGYNQSAAVPNFYDNQWHLYVSTKENGTMKIYMDGELIDTETGKSNQFTASALTLRFGRGQDGDYWYEGVMDEVAIWDRALSATDVSDIYNTTFVSNGIADLGLSYDTDDLNQLAYLYGAQGSGLVLNDITWSYAAGLLPGDDGSKAIGDGWEYGGAYYIKLGSGLKGETGGTAPEPATVVAIVFGGFLAAWRRLKKKLFLRTK